MSNSTYFCPDCGWEGSEPICAVCGSKTESLDVDPNTGVVSADETDSLDEIDDLADDDWDGEDDSKTL